MAPENFNAELEAEDEIEQARRRPLTPLANLCRGILLAPFSGLSPEQEAARLRDLAADYNNGCVIGSGFEEEQP